MFSNIGLLKIYLCLFLLISYSLVWGQASNNQIMRHWVKTKVTYRTGEELDSTKRIKNSYLRYSFEKPNKLFVSTFFSSKGVAMTFKINNNVLKTSNSFGVVINDFLIEKIDEKELIILQKENNSFEDDFCLRYHFIDEEIYQNTIILKPEDIISIYDKDTLFNSSSRIYAKYGNDVSLDEYLRENIPKYHQMQRTKNHFLASFIIDKNGKLDSIQILEGIDKDFDSQFLKAIRKDKHQWIPAKYKGQNIDVLMYESFTFILGDDELLLDYSREGAKAMEAKEYRTALYYFNQSLWQKPNEIAILYQRAICNLNLGNKLSACKDLQKIKLLNGLDVTQLIEKNCE